MVKIEEKTKLILRKESLDLKLFNHNFESVNVKNVDFKPENISIYHDLETLICHI